MTKPKFLWKFDPNSREYTKPEPGREWGRIIWIKHWRKREIKGETSHSWILEGGERVAKAGRHDVRFTRAEVEQVAWVHDHRCRIAELVRDKADYHTLQHIDMLITAYLERNPDGVRLPM